MAIDSAEKRKAISGIGGPPLIPGVTPNAAKDVEWRQESAWSYPGIAPDSPAPAVTDHPRLHYRIRLWRR